MTTTTTTVAREAAEAVLAAVRKQFRNHCATHAEIAEMFADDPELVATLTTKRDGTPKPEAPQPKLVENWQFTHRDDPAPFAIVWEEGPYEWAYNAIHGGVDEEMTALMAEAAAEFGGTAPVAKIAAADPITGVETEPITGWALGVYAATEQ